MTNFKYEVDQDGIALITWDMPGRSMNVLNAEVLSELESLFDKTTADSNVKGVVVTTGKDTFSGGADLTVLQKLSSQFEQVRKSQGERRAAASSLRLPVTVGSPATTRAPASACRRSRSACSPAPVAPRALPAFCRPPMPCSICSKATSCALIAPRR